ncbi:MAG TPA: PA0069 family radical SAM protein [bacterium]|nr:PA0069 family radical SAM protein [bacterium]
MARAVSNPPNPWESLHREWLEAPPPALPKVWEEEARSVLSRNDSPDIHFRWSLNPYRGCAHACAYCYARPSHQYLGHGAGTDFETQLIVKTNAPQVLRKEFSKASWKGETILFSGNTDCYQPLEASYGLTRACLQVCLEHRQSLCIITKGALIRRDIDVLAALSREARVHVTVSLAWMDEAMSRALEPGAPSPSARLAVIRALSQAGISVGLGLAPIIPGLNDAQIPALVEAAAEAGASTAFRTLLRLPSEVEDVFSQALRERLPSHADKVLSLTAQMRGGRLKNSTFGQRMTGRGPLWDLADQLFQKSCARAGLNLLDEGSGTFSAPQAGASFRRPSAQGELFA